jgi:hypothetical protein
MKTEQKPIYIGTPAAPKLLTDKGREYVLDATMRQAAERASFQPKLHTICSNINNPRNFED